jgi:hypothetical protein
LETLYLTKFRWNIPDIGKVEFPWIQQLTFVKNKMRPIQELEFLARCPKVRFFRWQPLSELQDEHLPQTLDMLHSRLVNLRTLAIPHASLKDQDIAAVMRALPALVNLHARSSQFGAMSTLAIVESKNNLQELDVCECESTDSAMIQDILSSCPDLETFGGDIFDMKDLARGKWACVRLKKLHISIMGSESAVYPLEHARMYDQLAALTELIVLSIGDVVRVAWGSYDWIELTLDKGFGRMSTLTNLEFFTVGRVQPPLGDAEREWIQTHWPNTELLEYST